MIQFNLLPDVKIEYIKARRAKRVVILISAMATSAALAIFVLLFITVNIFQKNHIADLTEDIESQRIQLEEIEDLDKILTIQNQLNSITSLHETKPVTTRLFNYLPLVIPEQAKISTFELSFAENVMQFTGTADSLITVNKFVDTLKFTTYTLDGQEIDAFSSVVLADFGKTANNNAETNFIISLVFDPLIFDSTKQIALKVPNIISTRSETEKPSSYFGDQADSLPEEGSQ